MGRGASKPELPLPLPPSPEPERNAVRKRLDALFDGASAGASGSGGSATVLPAPLRALIDAYVCARRAAAYDEPDRVLRDGAVLYVTATERPTPGAVGGLAPLRLYRVVLLPVALDAKSQANATASGTAGGRAVVTDLQWRVARAQLLHVLPGPAVAFVDGPQRAASASDPATAPAAALPGAGATAWDRHATATATTAAAAAAAAAADDPLYGAAAQPLPAVVSLRAPPLALLGLPCTADPLCAGASHGSGVPQLLAWTDQLALFVIDPQRSPAWGLSDAACVQVQTHADALLRDVTPTLPCASDTGSAPTPTAVTAAVAAAAAKTAVFDGVRSAWPLTHTVLPDVRVPWPHVLTHQPHGGSTLGPVLHGALPSQRVVYGNRLLLCGGPIGAPQQVTCRYVDVDDLPALADTTQPLPHAQYQYGHSDSGAQTVHLRMSASALDTGPGPGPSPGSSASNAAAAAQAQAQVQRWKPLRALLPRASTSQHAVCVDSARGRVLTFGGHAFVPRTHARARDAKSQARAAVGPAQCFALDLRAHHPHDWSYRSDAVLQPAMAWHELAPMPVAHVSCAAVYVRALDSAFVVGGTLTGQTVSHAVQRYHCATNRWSQWTPLPVPTFHAQLVLIADASPPPPPPSLPSALPPLQSVAVVADAPAANPANTGTATAAATVPPPAAPHHRGPWLVAAALDPASSRRRVWICALDAAAHAHADACTDAGAQSLLAPGSAAAAARFAAFPQWQEVRSDDGTDLRVGGCGLTRDSSIVGAW